ncbi:MAG: DNA mismatch repair protein MutS [bacterium]|nr:DNA mismatch repair protein MutS [bacterium]
MAEDISKATPMMQQYLSVKANHQDCLLMYRMGDFYELFFDDAIIASKALDIALTHRGTYMGRQVPMCGVPYHAFSSYMPKLVRQGFKVAICDQMESPEEAKKRGYKAVVKREVSRIITAGTLTEDNLLNGSFNNYLMSLVFNDGLEPKISVALTDISTGEFTIYTFEENAVSELLSLVVVKNPAEIILSEGDMQNPKLESFISQFKSKIVVKPDTFFDLINAKQNICDVFKVAEVSTLGNFSSSEVMVQGAILNYIHLTQIGQIPNISKPHKESNSDILQIDAFSVKNLEIFENINDETTKSSNLFAVMDKTKTPMGKRELKRALSSPLANSKEINNRLNIVDFFFSNSELIEKIREILAQVFDIQRIISRISCNRAGPRDLLNVGDTLNIIPTLKALLLQSTENVIDNPIQGIIDDLKDFSSLAHNIQNAIIDEPPLITRDGGFIKQGYHPALDEYKSLSQNTKQVILDLQAKYSIDTQVLNLKIKYNNLAGYFIEVPTKQATKLLEPNSGFTHKQTLVNCVRFTTPELSEIEQKILVAQDKCLSLELSLFDELCKSILSRVEDINLLSNAIAKLDLYSSLALLAMENDYVKPIVDDSLSFEIVDGRHPVVEANLKHQNIAFIPNDCILENKGDDSKLWILTGPNMAGKSTFLRQNAIITIMAQIGSFVPASSAHIGVVNKLFSRVGASDNLARGQSTFMVEMSETATILNQADERSFVILDEIGRGTATFDGLSIAWAVLEYLNNINRCRGIFATHYHELTSAISKMKNVSAHTMEIKEYKGDVVFIHKVGIGVADKSYGIHVAKIAGIPSEVISRASQILENFESDDATSTNKKLVRKIDEMDLFSYKPQSDIVKKTEEDEKLIRLRDKLKEINPDDLSPKSALSIMYEIKDML